MLGEKHIQSYIEQYDGDCSYGFCNPIIVLGPFLIVKESNSIRLVKSKVSNKYTEYSNQIDLFDKETSSDLNLDSIPTKRTDVISDLEIVKECVRDKIGFNIKEIDILFSKRIRYSSFKVILFNYKNNNYFAIRNCYGLTRVGLYHKTLRELRK